MSQVNARGAEYTSNAAHTGNTTSDIVPTVTYYLNVILYHQFVFSTAENYAMPLTVTKCLTCSYS